MLFYKRPIEGRNFEQTNRIVLAYGQYHTYCRCNVIDITPFYVRFHCAVQPLLCLFTFYLFASVLFVQLATPLRPHSYVARFARIL